MQTDTNTCDCGNATTNVPHDNGAAECRSCENAAEWDAGRVPADWGKDYARIQNRHGPAY